MRLSVLIPTFDAAPTIGRCLDSLAAEGLAGRADAEVIVVDDASGDGTADLVAARFAWVRVVRLERNVGSFAARTAALAQARGAAIAFLDADCVALPGFAPAALSAGSEGVAVMGRVVAPPRFFQRALAIHELGEFVGAEPRDLAAFATLNVVLPADLLREHPFDPRLRHGGDRELSWRLHRRGVAIRFAPAQAVLHEPPLGPRAVLGRGRRYARTFVALRRLDPTLPAARLLALGPLAAPVVAAGRLVRDLSRLLSARRALAIPWAALPAYALALAALRLLDVGFLAAALVRRPAPSASR